MRTKKQDSPTFSMRFKPAEKTALRKLARLMRRSQADTIRVLIHERLESNSLANMSPKTAIKA